MGSQSIILGLGELWGVTGAAAGDRSTALLSKFHLMIVTVDLGLLTISTNLSDSAPRRPRPPLVSRNSPEIMLDRRTTLCLACSSSLPPNVDDSELFMTKCCRRPICPKCLETNPRLERYNPCLACLAGVGVIQATRTMSRGKNTGSGSGVQPVRVENLDGGVKDQDLFVLGDDDDEDDGDGDSVSSSEEDGQARRSAAPPPPDMVPTASHLPETPPPPPPVTGHMEEPPIRNTTPTPPTPDDDQQSAKPDTPVVYRLRRGDTLMGIALRFRLDVRLLFFMDRTLFFFSSNRPCG